MSRWKASRWGHHPISPQSSPNIHSSTAHVLQSRLDWVLHPRSSDIWTSIASLFFGLWSKSSNKNVDSCSGTMVIWHFVWIFRWHKYLGTDSQRDRGDTSLQHLTSRRAASPRNARSTAQDLAARPQHSHLSPKGACVPKRHSQGEQNCIRRELRCTDASTRW